MKDGVQQELVDGRYEVAGLLGSGGMAQVYLARDRVLGRDVALKVLRRHYAEDGGFVERFHGEARNAAGLSHPNIVQVYDRGCSGSGEYYIAMEYVPGGTLKDRLADEGPLGPEEAAVVAGQIAGALSEAHEKGVIHRDIKPHNVLLGRSPTAAGGVKVADFGIARAASSPGVVTATSVILGTAAYMSPEQAKGEPATPKSDLYSLGVVLYEMLTGSVPYEAQTPVAVAVKHISHPPRLPKETHPDVPDGLNDVAAKLLAKDPADRYASAAEVAEDLRRVRRGERPPVARGAARREAREAHGDPTMVLGAGGSRRRGKRASLLVLAASVFLVASLSAVAGAMTAGRLEERDEAPAGGAPAALLERARLALGGEAEVPDVVGLGRAEAQRRLIRAGFDVEVRARESLEAEAGKVLGQSLPGGENAEGGATVSLDVGDGPHAVPAPDLAGLTLAEARSVLEEAGLKLGEVSEAPSGDVPEGAVVKQDPADGEELEPGARVNVTLSTGPEEPPAPQLDPEPVPQTAPEPAPETAAPATVPPPSQPAPQQYDTVTYSAPAPPAPAPQQYELPATYTAPQQYEPAVPSPLRFALDDDEGGGGGEEFEGYEGYEGGED